MNAIEACFTGRVTSDPESRISAAGKTWMKFSAAIGEGETVQYCQVAVFGDQAAKLSGQIAKGSKIYAEGRLKLDRWQKDGQEKSGLSLSAWRCDLIAQIGKNKPSRERMGGAPITASSFDSLQKAGIVYVCDLLDRAGADLRVHCDQQAMDEIKEVLARARLHIGEDLE